MPNTKRTPESMGQELARDIEAFANALEAAGIEGPHFDTEQGTVSLPLVAILFAPDQRKTHPDQVPTREEIRQQLVGTIGPHD